ncbi:MAG: hypothetical protein RR557_08820 [Bacilli bacterium]
MTFYDYVIRYMTEYDHVLNTEKTMIRYCFEIRNLADKFSIELRNEFNRDIDFLINDPHYLLDLELKIHADFPSIYKNRFSFILKVLSHYSKNEITRPSSFFIGNNEFKVIELYAVNKSLTVKIIELLHKIYLKLTPLSQKVHFKLARKVILDSNKLADSNSLEQLANRILENKQLDNRKRSAIYKIREEKITIVFFGSPHNITRYYKLNPIVLSQYEKIQKSITNKTEYKRFCGFATALNNHFDKYPNDVSQIKIYGLLALAENNYEILIKLRSYLETKIFKYVVFVIEILTNEKFKYSKYDYKCLYIDNKYGSTSSIRLKSLYDKSERFGTEFYNFFQKYISDIKYHDSNDVSVKTNITVLKYIFIAFADKKFIDEYGLNILSADDYVHFRVIKARIHDLATEKKIKPVTQNSYYLVLKWFCEVTKQKYIRDYEEALQTNIGLAKNDLLTNSYSQKDLMAILNHLIKAIKINRDDCSRLVVAYFALIQIVTGLNISTLCSLKDTEDHIKVDDNNENLYYFNFIKPRASHGTETHIYFKNTEDKILYLYLYVRDKLRKQVIEQGLCCTNLSVKGFSAI